VRVCAIGKFPPIQGGVSMRNYWTAHGLAARGHEVHVFTNAKEARAPYRMHMRAEDWKRCEATYGAGSVVLHWTDPLDRSQTYIPSASPFVTKLAATAARAHRECRFDVIYSHYLEPYGVAGHLAAEMTGLPHVVRMAGSDAGRLWHHPQFEDLYDHVLRSAEVVVAVGSVAERAAAHGVAPDRIVPGGDFAVPADLFTPEGPELDLAALRSEVVQDPEISDLLWGEFAADRPYFGVYGKLGERKGSFALLAALHRLKRAGLEVGLVALAHGGPPVQKRFRAQAIEFGLADRILQLPFLPHWRVPEFLRGCLAVCCLEQDFPIGVHAPIIPREVLMSGTCLVGSTEVIRKLPSFWQLPHGYGCVAIQDVNDIETLSARLAAIVEDPKTAAEIGTRGRDFACDVQKNMAFPQRLERILESATARQRPPTKTRPLPDEARSNGGGPRFPLTFRAATAIAEISNRHEHAQLISAERAADLTWARQVLDAIESCTIGDDASLRPLAQAVRIEIAIATTEDEADTTAGSENVDPLFRLCLKRWAMNEDSLPDLVTVRDPQLRIVEFDFDVAEFLGAETVEAFPAVATPRPSHIAAFGRSNGERRDPLLIDELTARILRLSDGTRTTSEIAKKLDQDIKPPAADDHMNWIRHLFLLGLVSLRDTRVESVDEVAAC
jgi:glycosyltransferase involved in cell wall biosynthesis